MKNVTTKQNAYANKKFAYLSICIAILCLGFSAIFVRKAGLPGAVSGFYRMSIATAIMVFPLKHHIIAAVNLKTKMNRISLFLAILAGVIFGAELIAWNTSVLNTSVANSTLLVNTAPIWVALGRRIFFKKKLQPVFVSGLLLASVGVSLVLNLKQFSSGDALACLAGLLLASYYLMTEIAGKQISAQGMWWISALSASVCLGIYVNIKHQMFFGYSLNSYLWVTAVAVLTQVVGYLSISFAVRFLGSGVVSASLLGQPVVTAFLGALFLEESIVAKQVLGGTITIIGLLVILYSGKARDPNLDLLQNTKPI